MKQIIRDLIVEKIQLALEEARREGVLHLDTLPPIAVEHPSNPEHGDFASSLPLRLARATRISPMKIAEELVKCLPPGDQVEQVWVAAPGFINFRLRDQWLAGQVGAILAAGEGYGALQVGSGQRVLIEYVSVNPTGPVTWATQRRRPGEHSSEGPTGRWLLSDPGVLHKRRGQPDGSLLRLYFRPVQTGPWPGG